MEHTRKIKYLLFICGRGKPIKCPANYSVHAGDVERVQHYAIVDTRKRLELGVAGDPFLVWTGL